MQAWILSINHRNDFVPPSYLVLAGLRWFICPELALGPGPHSPVAPRFPVHRTEHLIPFSGLHDHWVPLQCQGRGLSWSSAPFAASVWSNIAYATMCIEKSSGSRHLHSPNTYDITMTLLGLIPSVTSLMVPFNFSCQLWACFGVTDFLFPFCVPPFILWIFCYTK